MGRMQTRQCTLSNDVWFFAIWIIILFVLGLGSYVIITAASSYGRTQEQSQAREWPPRIDRCDLPTWERIRKMCPKGDR